MMIPKKYVLKNISKADVHLGDLRYSIPAGQSRNLLSRTAHLKWADIEKSRKYGSISKRLGKLLVEIMDVPPAPKPPLVSMAEPSKIVFPQKIKSSIIIDVGDISDEVQQMSLVEDEEFLKQLGDVQDAPEGTLLPIMDKDGGDGGKAAS
jgi:hypothetical protein